VAEAKDAREREVEAALLREERLGDDEHWVLASGGKAPLPRDAARVREEPSFLVLISLLLNARRDREELCRSERAGGRSVGDWCRRRVLCDHEPP
jgi:hypothetical protein